MNDLDALLVIGMIGKVLSYNSTAPGAERLRKQSEKLCDSVNEQRVSNMIAEAKLMERLHAKRI